MTNAATYRERAARFRKLAAQYDERTAAALIVLACEYEAEADRLDAKVTRPPMPSG